MSKYVFPQFRQFFERTEFVSKIKKSVNKRKVTYKTSEWEIAKKEFMINGFFCTVEWALFSAVVDSDTKYKEIAIKIIGQIRNHFNEKSQSEQAIPRKNILPSDFINFDSANDFWELLPIEYWANNPDLLIQYDKKKPPMKVIDLYLHQPPLFCDPNGFSVNELNLGEKLLSAKEMQKIGKSEILNYPSNTINVERHVQISSQSSLIATETKKMTRSRKRQATHLNMESTRQKYGKAKRSKLKYQQDPK